MPLPASQPVVTQLTIDASGAAAGAAQYDTAMLKAEAAANKLVAANDNLQKLLIAQGDQMKQVAAANDNVTRSWGGIVDGAEKVGSHLENTSANILNTINHLKLLALGAYALSPAFRGIVNAAIPAAIGLIGTAAAQAAAAVLSFMAPMLSFFARITGPIAAAVLAWKALVYVWQQGAGLLDKYANFNRNNFTPSNGAQALADATKFQQSDLSADQIARANELGTRLDAANQKIHDFFKVSFDVTNLALGLQTVWVNIVEAIASAVGKLQGFLDSVPGWIPTMVGVLARGLPVIGGALTAAQSLTGLGAGSGGATSTDAALDAARKTLAAGMAAKFSKGPQGNSFDARFWNFATQSPEDKDKNSSNAYDRAVQSIKDQIELLKLEADGVGKTTQQYQEMKVAHELTIAAMKAGIEPTDAMKEEWKKLGDQVAEYTIKARAAAALTNEQFKGATLFMSPSEQAAANVAHQIDPNDWASHMHDLAAETARFNSEMTQVRDTSVSFLQSFNNDIINGTVSMNTLANATKGLANTLLSMAEKNLVNAVLGPLMGGGPGGAAGGGFNFLKLFGFKDGGDFIVPAGPGSMFLPGFANGTDFTVPGSGGPDTKVMAARVSPGERVTITPPGRGTGGGDLQITVATTVDKDGNIMSFVQNIAGRIAGQAVSMATPGIVRQATSSVVAANKNAPGLLRKV